MATIQIADLHLRTIIGIYEWERKSKQDVLINVSFEYDSSKAVANDQIKDSVDYKAITKEIIETVQSSQCYLLEKLADLVLKIVMKNEKVSRATVRVDKPLAIRFAKSVSAEISAWRDAAGKSDE